MCFMVVIIHNTPRERKAQGICPRITHHLDIWEAGQHATLLTVTVAEIRSWIAHANLVSDKTKTRAFNYKVLNDKLQAKLRIIHGQGMDGILYPGNAKSNT